LLKLCAKDDVNSCDFEFFLCVTALLFAAAAEVGDF